MDNLFKVGDKVRNKNLGPEINGVIREIFAPGEYLALLNQVNITVKNWDKMYPDWNEKAVYSIALTDRTKTVTWTEFKSNYKDISDEELHRRYINLPSYSKVALPEDDLVRI